MHGWSCFTAEGATLGYQGAQQIRESQLKREKLIPIDLQHAGCPLNFMGVYIFFFSDIYNIQLGGTVT